MSHLLHPNFKKVPRFLYTAADTEETFIQRSDCQNKIKTSFTEPPIFFSTTARTF